MSPRTRPLHLTASWSFALACAGLAAQAHAAEGPAAPRTALAGTVAGSAMDVARLAAPAGMGAPAPAPLPAAIAPAPAPAALSAEPDYAAVGLAGLAVVIGLARRRG